MTKMRKWVALTVALVMIFVAGCGNGGNNASGNAGPDKAGGVSGDTSTQPVELTMWSSEMRSRDIIERSVEEFNSLHDDINLKVEFFEDEALKLKMKVAISSNEIPDLITYWSGETFDQLVANDMLADLTNFLNETPELKDNVLPGGLETFEYDGKYYGIPVLFSGVALWYNKNIFEENGLTPPTTFDELLDVVDQLNEKNITPIAVAGKERWPVLHWYAYLAQRIGGTEPFEKARSGEADFTQESFIQAGELLKKLAIDHKGFVNGFMGLDYANAEQLFMNERAAMYLQGEWAMEAFLEDPEFADKVGFVKFPAVDGGVGSTNIFHGGFGVGMAVSARTELDAALKALKFLTSPEQRKEIYEGPNISPMANPGIDEANMHPLAYAYSSFISENLEGYFGYYDQTLDALRADTLMNAVSAIVGDENSDVHAELSKVQQ